MKGKKISNIVFYRYFNSKDNSKQACIFYADGTVQNVSYDEGIDACEEIVHDLNIHTKDAFREMINHNMVHVMSGKDFEERFNSFVPSTSVIEEPVHEETDVTRNVTPVTEEEEEKIDSELIERLNHVDTEDHDDLDDDIEEETTVRESGDIDDKDIHEEDSTSERVVPVPIPVSTTSDDEEEEELVEVNDSDNDTDTNEDSYGDDEVENPDAIDTEIEDSDLVEEEPKEEKKGFFRRLLDKIKKNKIVTKVVAVVTALAIGLGLYSCAKKMSKDGFMARSNLTSITETDNSTNKDDNNTLVLVGDNSLYNNYSYNQLLDVTENTTQKTAMTNLGQTIYGFNDTFSSHYLEDGKDIRAALKFDEMVALQMAYNDYSKDQIKAYFNGSEIRADELSRSYKDATLQLMGAHVLETKEHPVDMSGLIESQEGKDFYKKYHEMFIAAKEAKGDEKIQLVTAFYTELRKDFPVTHDIRTEGISHAENYESLEAYKLSVTPMVAAAEMLWQNLAKDVTLNDEEVEFFNDIGLCNYADNTFERIETITLASETDSKNPLYSQYRDSIIKELKEKGIYYIDDEHRELSKLDAFKNAVNWHFNEVKGKGTKPTSVPSAPVTTTRTETNTHTETETTYHTETEVINIPVTPEAKAEVDAQLAKENEEARRKAEQEAEKERQRLQAEADKQAQAVIEEVRRDEKDLQEDIKKANDRIDDNNSDQNPNNDIPVNEEDFGDHDVDFDDEHSDEHGNLDPSVEDITTDPTGDRTNDPLPDPNQTGADFDREGEATYGYSSSYQDSDYNQTPTVDTIQGFSEEEVPVITSYGDDAWVETVPVEDDYYYEDAWIEYGDGTNEKIVNNYVDYLASDNYGGNLESESYEYTK